MKNLQDELSHAFTEWRRLAQAEGAAIRSGNWSFFAECQRALSSLRGTIDYLTAQAEQIRKPENHYRKSTSRSSILELIELQRQNLLSLQQRRERLSSHIEHVVRTTKTLRGIQRSYRGQIPSAWNSYS